MSPHYSPAQAEEGLGEGGASTSCGTHRGLLDRSTALYFYKQLKTILHKTTGDLLENLFSRNYAVKNNIQLLE
jgi:hypothetical protein